MRIWKLITAFALAVVKGASAFAQVFDDGHMLHGPVGDWERVAIPLQFPVARSGHCCALMSSNPDGSVASVDVGQCSEEAFREPTRRALWKYRFSEDAATRHAKGKSAFENFVTYYYDLEDGTCVPDIDGGMCTEDGAFDKELDAVVLCRADWVG